jgi:hypothetical protein
MTAQGNALGTRPTKNLQALKGRPKACARPSAAPSGLKMIFPDRPRALPWAIFVRPFGA